MKKKKSNEKSELQAQSGIKKWLIDNGGSLAVLVVVIGAALYVDRGLRRVELKLDVMLRDDLTAAQKQEIFDAIDKHLVELPRDRLKALQAIFAMPRFDGTLNHLDLSGRNEHNHSPEPMKKSP
jgi:hypothetical protein